jgi:hypothetical protein
MIKGMKKMSKENELLSYIKKLRNMADYLARGYVLQSSDDDTAIEIVDDEMTKQRNAFSVQEYSLYDELELSYFGEQRSIGILMEYIEEGEYEKQVEGKIDFDEPYIPDAENAEFYKRVMKRINIILKMMALSLASGSRIPLETEKFVALKKVYLDEDELSMHEDEKSGSLIYDMERQCFCAINSEGEIIVENVDINVAMNLYNRFLLIQEQDELYKKAIEQENRNREETDQEERE